MLAMAYTVRIPSGSGYSAGFPCCIGSISTWMVSG